MVKAIVSVNFNDYDLKDGDDVEIMVSNDFELSNNQWVNSIDFYGLKNEKSGKIMGFNMNKFREGGYDAIISIIGVKGVNIVWGIDVSENEETYLKINGVKIGEKNGEI